MVNFKYSRYSDALYVLLWGVFLNNRYVANMCVLRKLDGVGPKSHFNGKRRTR